MQYWHSDPNFFTHSVSPFLNDNTAVAYYRQNKYNYKFISQYKLKQAVKHSIMQQYGNIKPIILQYHIDTNTRVELVPSTVESVFVAGDFTHSLSCFFSLPSLSALEFERESKFNRSLDGCLPSTLERLVFGKWSHYNQVLPLPHSIRIVELACESLYYHPIDHFLDTITTLILILHCYFDRAILQLPSRLRVLHLLGGYNHPLPTLLFHMQYLEEISLGTLFNHEVNTSNRPPKSLKKLIFGDSLNWSYFNQSLSSLPESLEFLSLSSSFSRSLAHLPEGLKEMSLVYIFRNENSLS